MLWIALVPLGLIAYMTYLAFTIGHPLDPFTHQQHWGRYFFPLGGIPLGIWKVLRETVALVPSLEPHLAHNLTLSGSIRHIYSLAFLILCPGPPPRLLEAAAGRLYRVRRNQPCHGRLRAGLE